MKGKEERVRIGLQLVGIMERLVWLYVLTVIGTIIMRRITGADIWVEGDPTSRAGQFAIVYAQCGHIARPGGATCL